LRHHSLTTISLTLICVVHSIGITYNNHNIFIVQATVPFNSQAKLFWVPITCQAALQLDMPVIGKFMELSSFKHNWLEHKY